MNLDQQNLLAIVGSVISAMMGGGYITAALAKRYINKMFSEVDQLSRNFAATATTIAVLTTKMDSKMESIDKLTNLVMEHALQIARLEAKTHVRNAVHHSDH